MGEENKVFEIFDPISFVSRHLGIQVPSKEKEDITREILMDKLKISSEQEKVIIKSTSRSCILFVSHFNIFFGSSNQNQVQNRVIVRIDKLKMAVASIFL